MPAVIECVPNISEGVHRASVDEIAAAVRSAPGVRLLDVSSDSSHNRSVLTFVGDAAGIRAGVAALFEAALPRIDLTKHKGEHPRVGAVDVVPIIPIRGATVADVALKLQELKERYAAQGGRISHLDGISVDFDDWHFNVRPSNTEPLLRLCLESLVSRRHMEAKRDEVLALIRA